MNDCGLKHACNDLLGLLGGAVLIVAAVIFGRILIYTATMTIADQIQLLIFTFIAGTMFVGIWSHKKNEEFRRSSAYMENSVELMNRARGVLTTADGGLTNDRVSWVTAARLLTRAQDIAALISVETHRLILDAEHDYQRHSFGDLLRKNGAPLSAAFFTGVPDLSLSLGEAAYDPSQENDGQRWIPERILAVVYRFFQYPDKYEDPLDSSTTLSPKERDRLWLFGEKGVCDYLVFRKHFFPVRKVVYMKKGTATSSAAASAEQIDMEMANLSGTEE